MNEAWSDTLKTAQKKASASSRVTKAAPAQQHFVSLFSYAPALLVAFLKDMLDLAFITSLPFIGTFITFCFSLLIFFLLLLNGSGKQYSLTKKGIILMGGTIVEGIFFGLNFLPIETMTVFAIYLGDKRSHKLST